MDGHKSLYLIGSISSFHVCAEDWTFLLCEGIMCGTFLEFDWVTFDWVTFDWVTFDWVTLATVYVAFMGVLFYM